MQTFRRLPDTQFLKITFLAYLKSSRLGNAIQKKKTLIKNIESCKS